MSVLGAIEYFVAVDFPSAQVGYVTDTGGTVYRTDNGGRSWTTVLRLAARWPLKCLAFCEPAVGFVGSRNNLFRTDDGGTSWEPLSIMDIDHPNQQRLSAGSGSTPAGSEVGPRSFLADLQEVKFMTKDHGYALSWDMLLETTDGGYNWEIVEHNTKKILHKICFFNEILYAAGNDETIIKMDTRSKLVTSFSFESSVALLSIYFSNEATGVAVGTSGTIIRTQDGGDTWHRVESGTENFLCCVAFFNEHRGLAVGRYGTVLITDDGGSTWNVSEMPSELDLLDIAITSESTGYIACSHSIMLKTTDAGKTFHFLPFKPEPGTTIGLVAPRRRAERDRKRR